MEVNNIANHRKRGFLEHHPYEVPHKAGKVLEVHSSIIKILWPIRKRTKFPIK